MSVVRAFIALELPKPMQVALDKISIALQRDLAGLPLRWVKTENIHLTLKFVGETKQSDLPLLTSAIEAQSRQFTPIPFEFAEFGVFPNAHKPLVLWVGVKAPAELQALQQGIESACAQLGYPPEARPFAPHLTLARVRREHRLANLKRIGEVMASATFQSGLSGLFDAVTLFRSDLKPGGSIYHPLSSCPLPAAT